MSPGPMRTDRWTFRALDDLILSPPAGASDLLYAFRRLFAKESGPRLPGTLPLACEELHFR